MTRSVIRGTLLLAVVAATSLLWGQTARDEVSNILKPPAGARVALVIFEDLQCPDCARADPLMTQMSTRYKIPVLRYNFPLPMHTWANDAAVLAEYFETKSPELGVAFREYIFANQLKITRGNLRTMAEQFAQKNKTGLPFVLDPQGKLAEVVKQDRALGQRVNVSYTPTIYVVTGKRATEVTDRTQLSRIIEQMQAEPGS